MKKKIIASIVVLTLLFGMLPIYSQASDELRNPRMFDNYGNEIYIYPGCVTWDCVYFGSYWQKDSDGNIDKTKEKQPIKWRVLSVDGDDLFLLADQIIYVGVYKQKDRENSNTYSTWEESDIRNWIQNDFIINAFSNNELNDIVVNEDPELNNAIKDKVFLLSEKEAHNKEYGFNKLEDKDSVNGDSSSWWLRCDQNTSSIKLMCGNCYSDNSRFKAHFLFGKYGVRPALHLKKSSTHYKKAGTVNIYNEIDVERTPKPLPTMIPTQTQTPTPTNTPTPQTPKKVVKKVAAPSKPIKVKVKNNKKKTATVTWSKVSGAKGYRVQYAYSAPFSKKTKTVSTNKFVAKKLKKKKTYSFRVRAYKMNGKKKLYGKWSKVVRIKIKK